MGSSTGRVEGSSRAMLATARLLFYDLVSYLLSGADLVRRMITIVVAFCFII